MTRGWFSIAFGCAFGALIGTLTALEISARFDYGSYLWGIGALVGGIVAYVAIDFRYFCAGVVHSYRRTIAWRPSRSYWRAFLASWLMACSMCATSVTAMVALALTIGYLDRDIAFSVGQMMSLTYYGIVFLWPGMSLTFGPLVAFSGLGRKSKQTDEEYAAWLDEKVPDDYKTAFNISPFGVVYNTLRGLRWLMVNSLWLAAVSAKLAKIIATAGVHFTAEVFVYVHSQRRTICFVDAAIGAAVGYSFGSAIIGAIAGALLGVINYEIVSVRWLRLVPASR